MEAVRFIRKTLSLDHRSLALYRMLMGLIVMADVLYRLPDLVNFYTDIGLVPRSIFVSEMTMPWSLSFHLANGSLPFIVVMFALHFLLGLMLLVGYKSNWAMFGAFLMTVSVHNRNWLVNNGGDDILRALLFISIFLPLDKWFSVESAMRKEKNIESEHFSSWGLTFYLQVFVIYFVSYILKDHPMWRSDFSATFFASRLDIFATPFGIWLRNFPFVQKLATIFTIYLEWLGPIVLIFGAVFGKFWWVARMILIILFWILHLGIIGAMWIGVFPYLCLVMWTIFIPGPVWDRVFGYFRNRGFHKIKIFYDGECGFCQKGVRLIREFYLLPEVKIEEAQSSKEIHQQMQKNNSWVVVNEAGEKFFHFNAMVELMRHSPLLRWKASFFALKPIFRIGNAVYLWISHHRGLMGKISQYLIYREPKKRLLTMSWLHALSGVFIFTTLLMWNLTTIKKWNIKAPFFQEVTRWVHLYQEWNMFAPFPKTDNIWVEIPGVLSDGTEMEILTGSSNIFSIKDKEFPHLIANEHWRKFYLNLSERTDYSRYYGSFLCRWWNERKLGHRTDVTLRKMEIIIYSQLNLSDGDKGGITRKLSWKHWCFDEDYKKENP